LKKYSDKEKKSRSGSIRSNEARKIYEGS